MKPGDGLLALLLDARLGACGHPRQPHPSRPEVELPCATPECREGTPNNRLQIIAPLPRLGAVPEVTSRMRFAHLERSEAYIDGEDTPHPRFWLWRFA